MRVPANSLFLLQALERAEQLKQTGNDLYKKGLYKEALVRAAISVSHVPRATAVWAATSFFEVQDAYAEAQETAPDGAKQQRAVYFANSAAVRLKMQASLGL